MPQKVTGNVRGLSPSENKALLKVFTRLVDRDRIIGLDLAREIWSLSRRLNRKIGVLVNREGKVVEVMVGTKDLLYLPDLGRYRLGEGRLRRLRLVFTDLSNAPDVQIPSDIFADLEKLRLDVVAGIKELRNEVHISYAYISPDEDHASNHTLTEPTQDLAQLSLSFLDLMSDLDSAHVRVVSGRATGPDPTILIGVYERGHRDPKASMSELQELARTAGIHVVESIIQIRQPDPKTFLGKGKLQEVELRALRLGAEVIVFDTELKPSQWRVITNSTSLKVLDRSMLILDIFAQRATSSDGRLQVELAQLKYNLPRLVEQDAGLSRLTGGIGGRGPGETKLEIGRRRTRERIRILEKRIETLGKQRDIRRDRRRVRSVPLYAIVGYTNVGKSTLFNALTGSNVIAEDKLFATLDPTHRQMFVQGTLGQGAVVLSDTVGFIRDLPKELKSAFRATLEELFEATAIIHVLDASDPEISERKRAVEQVLEELGVLDTPQLLVLNKIDLVDPEILEGLKIQYSPIAISASTKVGFRTLLDAMSSLLPSNREDLRQ